MSLVEVILAMVLLSLVITGVDASLTVLNNRQIQVVAATEGIDGLQSAEEALSRDIHAAASWQTTTWGQPGGSPTPTSTQLYFTANLNKQTQYITATITGPTTDRVFTVSEGISPSTVNQTIQISNLDSNTIFAPVSCHVTVEGTTSTYYTAVGVTLSQDSPYTGARVDTRSVFSDPDVVAWNLQYAYNLASEATGATYGCP